VNKKNTYQRQKPLKLFSKLQVALLQRQINTTPSLAILQRHLKTLRHQSARTLNRATRGAAMQRTISSPVQHHLCALGQVKHDQVY